MGDLHSRRPRQTETTCASCVDVFTAFGVHSSPERGVHDRVTGGGPEDVDFSLIDSSLHVDPITGTIPAPGQYHDSEAVDSRSKRPTQHSTSPMTSSTDENDKKLVSDLECVLAATGIDSIMYLPSKSDQTGTANKRTAVLRKRRNKSLLEVEVFVDGVTKKFRFQLNDVLSVTGGKGRSNVVPSDVNGNMCLSFMIRNKGELTLVVENEVLRDDVVKAFNLLLKDNPPEP